MLTYADDDGNTVIHKMADCHDKLLLYPLVNKFKTKLNLGPNKEGKTIADLYNCSKLTILLH